MTSRTSGDFSVKSGDSSVKVAPLDASVAQFNVDGLDPKNETLEDVFGSSFMDFGTFDAIRKEKSKEVPSSSKRTSSSAHSRKSRTFGDSQAPASSSTGPSAERKSRSKSENRSNSRSRSQSQKRRNNRSRRQDTKVPQDVASSDKLRPKSRRETQSQEQKELVTQSQHESLPVPEDDVVRSRSRRMDSGARGSRSLSRSRKSRLGSSSSHHTGRAAGGSSKLNPQDSASKLTSGRGAPIPSSSSRGGDVISSKSCRGVPMTSSSSRGLARASSMRNSRIARGTGVSDGRAKELFGTTSDHILISHRDEAIGEGPTRSVQKAPSMDDDRRGSLTRASSARVVRKPPSTRGVLPSNRTPSSRPASSRIL